MSEPHVEYLLSMPPAQFYQWHSAKQKDEVVQSLYAVLVAMREERQRLLAVLGQAANMLSAVAGDMEDGGNLDTLRGKYVMALVEARDDARAAIAKAGKT